MNIYLAANEAPEHAAVLHALRYPYRLSSYYGMRGGKDVSAVVDMSNDGSHHILDSGLFSLMFGADAGKLTTFDQFKDYATKYVDDVKGWGWRHAIVECDTQIVLGVEETFRLREEVFEKSGLDVIYVWHVPETVDGLKAMARKYKRIALSVPELRRTFGFKRTKPVILACLRAIQESGGHPRVHLLGNTEGGLCQLPAESSDSSSWIYGVRFADARIYSVKDNDTKLASIRSPKWRHWVAACERMYPDAFARLGGMRDGERCRMLGACAVSYWIQMNHVKQVETVIA